MLTGNGIPRLCRSRAIRILGKARALSCAAAYKTLKSKRFTEEQLKPKGFKSPALKAFYGSNVRLFFLRGRFESN